MVSTVKSRPTHYDVLGLKPTATTDEIARAFAREISIFRPHTLNEIADVTVAYETLRNPAKRRAYDEALGLTPPPRPRPSLTTSGVGAASFVRTLGRVTDVAERPASPPPSSPPRRDPPPAEPGTTPIGAALRELASPQPLHDAVPAPVQQAPAPNRPKAAAEPTADPLPGAEPKVDLALDDGPGGAEEGSIPWKRVGIAAGGLLAVVGVGGWAGWQSGSDMPRQAQSEQVVALPPSTTFTVTDPAAAAPAPAPVLDVTQPAPPKRPATPVARPRPTSQLADMERQLAELPEAGTAPAGEAGQAAEAPAATAVPASMPLPKAVIARTIGRIGYPCGQVATTTAAEAPGVFMVTCTSGHSYRASPVRGRYRFRRVGG